MVQINLYPVGVNTTLKNNYTKSIQNNKNVCFKGYWDDDMGEFGVDGDSEGQKIRDAMRERMLFDRGVISANESNSANPEMRYANTIEDVNIKNFRKFSNSSYSGECLMHHPEYFELLHKSGVTKVVDLVRNQDVKEQCEKYGLEYILYDMYWGHGNHPIFCNEKDLIKQKSIELSNEGLTKKEYDKEIETYKNEIIAKKDEYIRNLAKFIKKLNLGQFYMSCEFGEFRTVNCLALISTFNPNWRGERIKPTYEYGKKFQNFYKNLTKEYKQILGIDKEYDKYLKNYIGKLAKTL